MKAPSILAKQGQIDELDTTYFALVKFEIVTERLPVKNIAVIESKSYIKLFSITVYSTKECNECAQY